MKTEKIVKIKGKEYVAVDDNLYTEDGCRDCIFGDGIYCKFYMPDKDGVPVPVCYLYPCVYFKSVEDED